MKRYIEISGAVLALALAVSCSKGNPELGNGSISISAGIVSAEPATKAPLSQADLTAGSTLKVYDILGTSFDRHIDGKTATKGTNVWAFAETYPWLIGEAPDLEKADHNFFGWLTKDKDNLTPAGLFGSEPAIVANDPDDGIYTMTLQKQMTLTSSQFDFCYSNLVQRSKTSNNYSVVPLQLSHLFTCFGISARNYTSKDVTIKSVKLQGLVNNKTAEIVYDVNTGESAVTYTASSSSPKSWSNDATAIELVGSNILLHADGTGDSQVANIITHANGGSKPTTSPVYYMMWPQTDAEMDNTVASDGDNWTYGQGEAVIVVTYSTFGSSSDIVVPLALRPASLDGDGWDAGTKHCIELSFTERFLELKATARPWDYTEPDIDYTASVSASTAGALNFSGCLFGEGDNADCIYFKNGNPITGYFKLDSPLDATWMISKVGDFDVFEIDNRYLGEPGDGVEFNYGTIDGNTAYFTIYPKITDPQRDYSITLTFAVRIATGNVINVDDLVQPKIEEGTVVRDDDNRVILAKRRIVLLAS